MIPSGDDIVDVQFETVGPAARKAGKPRPAADPMPDRGLGLFRTADRNAQTARKPMPLPLFALIATLSACTSFYVAGGHALFTATAAISHVTAPSSIVLEETATRIDTSGGRAVIVVRATIANATDAAGIVPPVAITFDRSDGAGSVTHTITRGERLASGERMAFTTRVPAGDYAGTEPRIALVTRQ